MYYRSLDKYLSVIAVSLITSLTSYAQLYITATVADSATLGSLPNVNVWLQSKNMGTVSDDKGHFALQAAEGDTLIFSMVGYHTRFYSVKKIRETGIVYLKQEQKILMPITIHSSILIPGVVAMPKESPWKNATYSKHLTETPGFHGYQTFGPGYILKGPISRFSKYEKERKKLSKVRAENIKGKNYVSIVTSSEVKDNIMKDFSISEEEYYSSLAIFNEKNQDIIYKLEAEDLILLLISFFAEKTKNSK
jgi:hypothetical protein